MPKKPIRASGPLEVGDSNTESLVYEPIDLKIPDASVRRANFIKLIAQLATEPTHSELPVIA